MIRGTTPTHTFNLSLDADLIHKVRVLYAQDGKCVLKKENDACTKDGCKVSVKLTQEETLLFNEGNVEMQLRVLTPTGDSFSSRIHVVSVDRLLEDEVFE